MGVLLPRGDFPLDLIADGIRNGLIRATPVVPLSAHPPVTPGPKDDTGKKGEPVVPPVTPGPDDDADGGEVSE